MIWSPKRITVNLSPADPPKDGSHYVDLPSRWRCWRRWVWPQAQSGDWIAAGGWTGSTPRPAAG
ncbi:MAG: hypothetical protein ACJLS3_14480 [Erythrobacter sp.]